MQSENFSPKESLQLIENMINQARNRFSDNGFLYLLWGWLILFCSLGHFVLLKLNLYRNPEIIWASCWVAVLFQVIYLARKSKKKTVSTYSENIIGYIWTSFGICMLVVAVIVGKNEGWQLINSLILVLYGIPTFLSGIVMQFKPLVIGGIACWVLAIASAFVLPVYVLLLLAAAVIAAWIIPGYLLRKKYRAQHS
jgi:uncharacterized membrane protein